MRDSLKKLFDKVITLKYRLPCDTYSKTEVSTGDDYAFKADCDKSVSDLIYNSIVDLAFDDYYIDINSLNDCQQKALDNKIRFNVKDQLALGFYGEALLNVFLQLYFGTSVLVARGLFFDLLSNSEIHGYDSHHIIETNDSLEFWFGEAKFYDSYSEALKQIWNKINDDIDFNYFNKNIQVIVQKNYEISAKGHLINKFINECKKDPFRNFYDDINKYNGKLVYPIFVISNELKKGFDETIKKEVDKINELNISNPVKTPKDLTVELFFIFLPVNDAKTIKSEVLKCIQMKKSLI